MAFIRRQMGEQCSKKSILSYRYEGLLGSLSPYRPFAMCGQPA